jgi:hypothetical protein
VVFGNLLSCLFSNLNPGSSSFSLAPPTTPKYNQNATGALAGAKVSRFPRHTELVLDDGI